MARTFTAASSEKIDLSLGAGASVSGAFTMAAIVLKASNTLNESVLTLGTTSGTQRQLRMNNTNFVGARSNNVNTASATTTLLVADGWALIAVTKAAGTATPRSHIYKYGTRTWVHEDHTATLADSTPSGGSAIGYNAIATTFWNGNIAVAGAWTTAMTDAQVETLAFSLTPWFSYSPNGLWVLDQASTGTKVWDLTGGGANESAITGTSVATSAVPVWNRGAPIRVIRKTTAVTPPVTTTASASVFTMAVGRHYGARRSVSIRQPSLIR